MLSQDYQDSISKLFNQQSLINLPNTAINSASPEYHNSGKENSVCAEEKNFKVVNGDNLEQNLHGNFDNELIDIEVKSLSDSEEILDEGFEGEVYASNRLEDPTGKGHSKLAECVEICDTFYVEEPESEEEGSEEISGLDGNWRERKPETTSGYRLIECHSRVSRKNQQCETTESDCLQQKVPKEVRENETKTLAVAESCEIVNTELINSVPESEIHGNKIHSLSSSDNENVSNAQGALKNIHSNYILSGHAQYGKESVGNDCKQSVSTTSNMSICDKVSWRDLAAEAVDGKVINKDETEGNINEENRNALIPSDVNPIESYIRSTAFDWCHKAQASQSSGLSTEKQQRLVGVEMCDEKMNKIHISGSFNQSFNGADTGPVFLRNEESVQSWSNSGLGNEQIGNSHQRCEGAVQEMQIHPAKEKNESRKSISQSSKSVLFSEGGSWTRNMSEGAEVEKEEKRKAAMSSTVDPGGASEVHSKPNHRFDTFKNNRHEGVSGGDNLENKDGEGHDGSGRRDRNGVIGYGTNDVTTSQNYEKLVSAAVCGCVSGGSCNGGAIGIGAGGKDEDRSIYLNSCSEGDQANGSCISAGFATIVGGLNGVSCSADKTCQCGSMENNNNENAANSTEGIFYAIGASTNSSYSMEKEQGDLGEVEGGGGGSFNEKHEFKSNNSSLFNFGSHKQQSHNNSNQYLSQHQQQNPVTTQTQMEPRQTVSSPTLGGIETKNRGGKLAVGGCDNANCYNTSCGGNLIQQDQPGPSPRSESNPSAAPFSQHLRQPHTCSSFGTSASTSCVDSSSSHNLKYISQMQHDCLQGGSNAVPVHSSDKKGSKRENIQYSSDIENESCAAVDNGLSGYNRSCADAAEPAIDEGTGACTGMSSSYASVPKNGKDSQSQNGICSNRNASLTTMPQSDFAAPEMMKSLSDNVVSSLSAASSNASGTAAAVMIKCDRSTEYKGKDNAQKVQHKLAMGANTTTNDDSVCSDDDKTEMGNSLSLHEHDLLVNSGRKLREDYDREERRFCPNQVPPPVTKLTPNKITVSHALGLTTNTDTSLISHNQLPIPAEPLCHSQATIDSNTNNKNIVRPLSSSSKLLKNDTTTCGRNFEHHIIHASEVSDASRHDTLQACESAIAADQMRTDLAMDGKSVVGNNGRGSAAVRNSSKHGSANSCNINKEYLNSTGSANAKSHTVVNSHSNNGGGGCGSSSIVGGATSVSSSSTPLSSSVCTATSTTACIHPPPNNICNSSCNSTLTTSLPPAPSSTYHSSVTNTSHQRTQNINPHHASFSACPVVGSSSSSEDTRTNSSNGSRNFDNIHTTDVRATPQVVTSGATPSNCTIQSQQNLPAHFHNRPPPSENAQVCNCCDMLPYQQGIPGYDNKGNPVTAAAQGLVIQDSNYKNSAPSLLAHPKDYCYDINVNNCSRSSSYTGTGVVPVTVENSRIFRNTQSQHSQRECGGCCQSNKSITGVPSTHYTAASFNRSTVYNQQSNYGNNSSAYMSCDEKFNAKDDETKGIQHFNSTRNSQSTHPSGAVNSLGSLQRDSSALHQLQEQKKLSCGGNITTTASNISSGSVMAEQSSSYHRQTSCSPCNPNQNNSALHYNCHPPRQGSQQQQQIKQNDNNVMPETALTHSLNQTPVYYEAPTKSGPCSECCQYNPAQMAPFPNNNHNANFNTHSSTMSPPGRPVRETSSNSSETGNSSTARQRLAGSLSTASDPSVSGGSSCSSDSSPAKTLPTFGRGGSKMSASGTSCAVKEKKKKESHGASADAKGLASEDEADHEEEHKLLKADEKALNSVDKHIGELPKNCFQGKRLTAYGGRAPGPVNPDMLYEGIQYKCAYLGSTQLISTSRPNRTLRMQQAHEAVTRIKAPDGEFQPSVEVFLHISTDKLALVNIDNNESIIEHPLRTISYIADIANIIVIMARRIPAFNGNNAAAAASSSNSNGRGAGSDSPDLGNGSHSNNADQSYADNSQYMDDSDADGAYSLKPNKIVCHILECDKAQLIAQSIGQAFHLAYLDFLKENGIEDESSLELEYLDVLNSQELKGEDLMLFANKEASKDISIFKQKGELIGVVVIESGWGSVVPTFVIANLSPTGPAARSGLLNVGDQLLAIDGTSVVGLTLANVQAKLKSMKSELAVRLTIVQCPPTTTVLIKRPSLRYQLGFSVQNGTICSLMRGGIAERGGIRVGHRIIEINRQSVVAVPHDKIVEMLATSVGQLHMKTMPLPMFRLLTGQDTPSYL